MTISIYTGVPGAGKTAMAINELLGELGDRPLFVWGVNELQIPHEPMPPIAEWTRLMPTDEDPNILAPKFVFPPHSVLLIDEAQLVFRPRASTSKVPDHVAALETHRHGGIDIRVITQHPRLLDVNVRDLCGKHVHIRNTAFGRRLYEWPEAADPKSKSDRDIAASRKYKLPKRIFSLYKSSTAHIKPAMRIPNAAYIGGGALLLLAFLSYNLYGRFNDVVNPGGAGKGAVPGQADPTKGPVAPMGVDPVLHYVKAQLPRVEGMRYTAPVYDGLTQPTRVPVAAACIATASKCRCWTQDATPYAVEDRLCREIVAGGSFYHFDPAGPNNDRRRDVSPASGPQTVARPMQQDQIAAGPKVVTIPDYGDYVGVSSRTRAN